MDKPQDGRVEKGTVLLRLADPLAVIVHVLGRIPRVYHQVAVADDEIVIVDGVIGGD